MTLVPHRMPIVLGEKLPTLRVETGPFYAGDRSSGRRGMPRGRNVSSWGCPRSATPCVALLARVRVGTTRESCITGKFINDGGPKVEIEDGALAHLQLVICAKLLRGEPPSFSWREHQSVGGGRTTVWVHAGNSLAFKYSTVQHPHINRAWVDALAFAANTPTGLYMLPEPAEPGERHHKPEAAPVGG